MSIDWSTVSFIAPILAILVAAASLTVSIMLHLRISKIFRSANVPDLERLLKLHTKTLEDFVKFKAESENRMNSLSARIKVKINKAPTLRFNPFQGGKVGGNQSFSSVFADEEGNGVVITSMHTRERTNVFAKPITGWASQYEFSDEEKAALNQARNGNTK